MTLFLTKVWGFDAPLGPLQFSTRGWRDNALRQLKPGDQVLLAGTTDAPTPPELRGRLLGVMEPTNEPVLSLDFDLRHAPGDFVDGEYKWPFGLMNRKAWSIPEGPLLAELIPRRFHMDAAQGIVPLTAAEEAQVRSLPWVDIVLLRLSAQAQDRMARKHGTARRASPLPTTKRSGIMHMRSEPAFTYALEIKGASQPAYKIGWAFDYKQRARQFNQAAMPDLGGLEYVPFRYHSWNTARLAFNMEQRLLAHFTKHRSRSNHEVIVGVSHRDIEAMWIQGVIGKL
ncbi:MAG: hypothetical protein B7Z40_08730 [Bosea sp. 12-68-7]|nr:MAG: hypothetical protein B7Z40_08730 [Bosea sp. 12-68-7]